MPGRIFLAGNTQGLASLLLAVHRLRKIIGPCSNLRILLVTLYFPLYPILSQTGIIQPQIYRANTIHQNNFPFIKTLGLKTILLLSSEIPTRGLMTFFEEIGVEVVNIKPLNFSFFIRYR